jgi:hypothetical protein
MPTDARELVRTIDRMLAPTYCARCDCEGASLAERGEALPADDSPYHPARWCACCWEPRAEIRRSLREVLLAAREAIPGG